MQETNGEGDSIIDERVLLSNTIATLKDDSEQKQKFETVYNEAEAASRAKSAFLSNMSHDIRTPMNAVIGMTVLALRHADEPKYVRDCLKKAQVSSQYLLDIINNVLDMSRIESGRFVLSEEPVELFALINELSTIIGPGVEARRQHFSIEIGEVTQAKVIGDSVLLTQVPVNILSNAVKFTPEGGSISLGMHQEKSEDAGYGTYVFTYADSGIGMSEEFVGHVFDTYSRAEDANTAKTEETGLGMAIAKNLVQLMGGTMDCMSEPGCGTVFTVALRMKFTDKNGGACGCDSEADESRGPVDLTGKRILLWRTT